LGEKIMSKEFDECLKKRKITEFERAKGLVSKELSSAAFDLKSAKDSFDEEDYKTVLMRKTINGPLSRHITQCFIPPEHLYTPRDIGKEAIIA